MFKVGVFKNRWLVAAIAWEITLLMLIIYVPALQTAFRTYALSGQDWAISVGAASTIFIGVEIFKLVQSRFSRTKA